MDLLKRLSIVLDLNDYIELTQDLENKYKDVNIKLNQFAIQSIRKHRSLEIEYFNKCDGSGAAFKLFEMMLSSSACKMWNILGIEVVGLIQYWLEAVRKHLISHHIHWWTFLRHILGFIKVLRKKDSSLSNLLVEETAEVMLDLATSGKMNVIQRHETLYTFNLVCSEATRELRLKLKNTFEPYFIRLSTVMATCGHFPSQFAAVETLLRWLQPRQDPVTRREAATKWLLPHLYSKPTVDIFLTRNWMNFLQDARDFLNCHNDDKKLVTSVICRKLVIGDTAIIKMQSDDLRTSWLDINRGNNTITVMLEPHHLESLGQCDVNACEALTIAKEHVKSVRFYRESSELKLCVYTVAPPVVLPSGARPLDAYAQPQHDCCEVHVTISTRSDLPRVDAALRYVFEDKYQMMLDLEETPVYSPLRSSGVRKKNNLDERSRLSYTVKEKRRQPHSGYVVWSKRFSSLKSPSTASTVSLAQLHDKLANLPYYEFTKEPVSVCAQPELSVVNELNESQISNSLESNSTLKLRRCAVKSFRAYIEDRKSQSDNEIIRKDKSITSDEKKSEKTRGSQSDNEYVNRSKQEGISALFAATIGSADESILNATFERLPKDKELNTDNLIELLVQEALQSKEERILDSGINTGDGKKTQEHDSETIEDTQCGLKNTKPKTLPGLKKLELRTPKNCTVVSKSTSDESNTEAINETPVNYVNVRRRTQRKISVSSDKTENDEEYVNDIGFDNQDVENFFGQHFAENQLGDVIISPTLAKKMNETSSEASDEFNLENVDDNFDIKNEHIPDLDVVECLNDIVDKVCTDFEKCAKYLDGKAVENEILHMAKNISNAREQLGSKDSEVSTDESKEKENKIPETNTRSKGKQAVKLKFNTKKQKAKPKSKKGKLKLEPVSKMSTILEDNNETDPNKTSSSDIKKISNGNEKKTPTMRRKRKLYSPKDDQIEFDRNDTEVVKTVDLAAAAAGTSKAIDDDDDDRVLAEFRKEKPVTPKETRKENPVTPMRTPKLITPKSVTSCYKEIEKERQQYRKIRACRSRGRKIETPPSPKTMKLNEVFEKLKDNIESNQNIIYADKKSDKDIAIFNFTSDSEDEDFKQKKVEIQKRTSTTTIGSGKSVMSTRRALKKVNYTEDCKESSIETNDKTAKRKRVTRRKNSKAKTVKSTIDIEANELIDERMRDAPREMLNTSFSAKNDVEIIKEPEPTIQAPQLEMLEDENANMGIDDIKSNEVIVVEDAMNKKGKAEKKNTRTNKKANKTKETKLIEAKNITLESERENTGDDGTSSPLPGLIIEAEKSKTDVDESLNTNMVKRFEKIYKEGPEAYNDTTTTQNMLSDNERPNCSPRMNITGELGIDREENTERKGSAEGNISDVIDDTINSDHSSKISKANSTKSKRNRLKLNRKKNNESTVTSDIEVHCSKNEKATKEPKKNKRTEQPICINESQKSKISVKSNIQEIDLGEIICVKSEIATRSKSLAKSRSKSHEIEVIDITNNTNNSERSIATEGITGHGEMDEMPPSPKLLGEKLSPREIQDMDLSIREYYVELNKEVNKSKDSADKVKLTQDKSQKKTAKRQIEDTKSEASSKSIGETRRALYKDRDYEIANMLPSRRNTESDCSSQASNPKSPVVSISRVSSREMAKWLPLTKATPQSSFENSKESSKPSTSKIPLRRSPRINKNRKSQISPINLEDFLAKTKIPCNDKTKSQENSENLRSLETATEDDSKVASVRQKHRYFLRPTHESSPISEGENSVASTPKVTMKRKSPVAETVESKIRRLDQKFRIETVDVAASRQSSNVDDWLRKISTLSRAEDNIQASYDTLQNLMEKLDTTLAEIHQNTTKDFISLFVEAQKQLVEMKEVRRNSYRETAVNVLTEVTHLLDRQFAEMDRQAEVRDNQFMNWLKKRAGEVLRRDCSQKRAMVALLREDVQAVVEHLGSGSQE